MSNTITRSIGAAAAIAAATSTFFLAAPAGAAPSSQAEACAFQVSAATNRLGLAAYAAEFSAEVEPIKNHEFIYEYLATARTKLQGGECTGFTNLLKADVTVAHDRINVGEAAVRAGAWADAATALNAAEKASSSAFLKVWRIAHPN